MQKIMQKDKQRAKELFAAMSKKEKVKHIFRYYWPHMALSLLAVFVAASLISSMIQSKREKGYVHIGLVPGLSETLEQPLEQLANQAGEQVKFLEVSTQEENAVMQMMGYLGANQLDMVICDELTRDWLLAQHTYLFYPLEQTCLQQYTQKTNLFLVISAGQSREEWVMQFARLLVTDTTP